MAGSLNIFWRRIVLRVIPVLFEDHTCAGFRPLAWSLPLYEMRVGVFNLRERVRNVMGENDGDGILLGRRFLADLHTDGTWQVGRGEDLAMPSGPACFLWLNGRLDRDHQALKSLFQAAAAGQKVFLKDEHGPLAMSCSSEHHATTLASWYAWEQGEELAGTWCDSSRIPGIWNPDSDGASWQEPREAALRWIWEIVPRTAQAISSDLEYLAAGGSLTRHPFGIFPLKGHENPLWAEPTTFEPMRNQGPSTLTGSHPVLLGPAVTLAPGTALDTTQGPILLDRGVQVMPHCYLEGPLYIGAGSTVKAGATIYGESSFGIMNKIAGEIGESTFGDFSNKQHEGFIGHAVLGSWVNLGAMTTNSDLKNNYGEVRVDLGFGSLDTGQRFVGLLMADHAKTAIGSLFNTGTTVGFASNIFGGGMPPKCVGNFSWGGQADAPAYACDRAAQTAAVVMARRQCHFNPSHEALFRKLSVE